MNKYDIKRIRIDSNLLQSEFAKIIGVAPHTVSMWERGKMGLSIRNKRKIIEFCNKYGIEAEV